MEQTSVVDISVGDTVRVARRVIDCASGWTISMDEYIGQIGVVEELHSSGVIIESFGGWTWPTSCLKILERKVIKKSYKNDSIKYSLREGVIFKDIVVKSGISEEQRHRRSPEDLKIMETEMIGLIKGIWEKELAK